MSLTFALTGKSSVLALSYFPAVNLGDGNYELGLTLKRTLANVNSNNKFYYDKEIVIPERLMIERCTIPKDCTNCVI